MCSNVAFLPYQDYSVHRVGSGTLVRGFCRITDLGVIVRLASDSGSSGRPSERGREGGTEGGRKVQQGTVAQKMCDKFHAIPLIDWTQTSLLLLYRARLKGAS